MRKALLLAVVMLAIAPSARASLVSSTHYFHCPDAATTPNGTATLLLDDLRPSLSEVAPTASMTTGGGCHFLSTGAVTGLNYENIYDVMAFGYVFGDIDSLTFTAYAFWAGPSTAALAPTQARFHLGIDGKSMFGTTIGTTGDPGPNKGMVVVTPSTTETPGLLKYEWTVTDLGYLGDDSAEHEIQLTINLSNPIDNPSNRRFGAGYFPIDTVEAPAGLTFNAETPAAATIKASTPGP